MHGERSLLTQYVFPSLNAALHEHRLRIYPIDLRWGVHAPERSANVLDLCLSEVQRADYILGIIGNRQGWVPKKEEYSDSASVEWDPREPNRSITQLELEEFGTLGADLHQSQRSFVYIRDPEISSIPKKFHSDFSAEDKEAEHWQNKFKQKLVNTGRVLINGYPWSFGGEKDGKAYLTNLETFGEHVLSDLKENILKDFAKSQVYSPEFESLQFESIIYQNNLHSAFEGRESLVRECLYELRRIKKGCLLLTGKPGSGKTYLLAQLSWLYAQSRADDHSYREFVCFIGHTTKSKSITYLLSYLCHLLVNTYSLDVFVPTEFKDLKESFELVLNMVSAKLTDRPLTIFLDGVDCLQNTHNALNMDWIPVSLPNNIIFVMSVSANSNVHRTLKSRRPNEVSIGKLDSLSRSKIVRSYLGKFGKTLKEESFNNQLKAITNKMDSAFPLYLRLACDELRLFGVYDKISNKLTDLPTTLPKLLDKILLRLEENTKNFSKPALQYIASSRSGLTESDLYGLLQNYATDYGLTLEPLAFRRMLLGVRSLLGLAQSSSGQLSNNTDVFKIENSEVLKAVHQRYFIGTKRDAFADKMNQCRSALLAYFEDIADPGFCRTFTGTDQHVFTDLTFYIKYCWSNQGLEAYLTNLHFIYAKCRNNLVSDLLEDFFPDTAGSSKDGTKNNTDFFNPDNVQEMLAFIRKNYNMLKSDPILIWQAALDQSMDSFIHESCKSTMDLYENIRKIPRFQTLSKYNFINDPCVLTISNLAQGIESLAIESDAQIFACGFKDSTIRIYDCNTGTELCTLVGHTGPIKHLSFIDSDVLCSASSDTTLKLWQPSTGKLLTTFTGHKREVTSCSANPKGKYLCSASLDCKVKIWNLETRKFEFDLVNDSDPINCVSYHPDGLKIIIGSWNSVISIWDVLNKTRVAVLRGHLSSVRSVSFSPDGKYVASASIDGSVKLWSANDGSQVGILSGHTLPVNELIYSSDGNQLLTASDDHRTKMWSSTIGKSVYSVGRGQKFGPVTCVQFSPDGRYTAVGYHHGDVRVLNSKTGSMVNRWRSTQNAVMCMAYEQETSDYLFTVSKGGDAMLDYQCGKNQQQFALAGFEDSVIACSFVHIVYVAVGKGANLSLYSLNIDIVRRGLRLAPCSSFSTKEVITALSFNNDQTLLAVATQDSSLLVYHTWDIRQNKDSGPKIVLAFRNCHRDRITCCDWSSRSDLIVTGSGDFQMKIWELRTRKIKSELVGHEGSINCVTFKKGCVVSGSSDGQVKVWTHKGTEITTISDHSARVNACAVHITTKDTDLPKKKSSSDWDRHTNSLVWQENHEKKLKNKGSESVKEVLVATGGDDGILQMSRPLESNEIASLSGHSRPVVAVAADKTGRVITGSLDGSLKIWRPDLSAANEEDLRRLHRGPVVSLAASPSASDLILSADRAGYIKVWNLSASLIPSLQLTFLAQENGCLNGICFTDGTNFVTATELDGENWHEWSISAATDGVNVNLLNSFSNPMNEANSDVQNIWTDRLREPLFKLFNNGTTLSCKGSTVYLDGGIEEPLSWDLSSKECDDMLKCTCVATLNDYILIGDNFGHLHILNLKQPQPDITKRPAHSGAVLFTTSNGDFLFTAGADMLIKTWLFDSTKTLKQVGQYYSDATVTSLICHGNLLIYGDINGRVHFLQWHCDPTLFK